MNKSWLVVVLVLCMGGLLMARQGVVKTKDGRRFEGDVTDRGPDGAVVMTKVGQMVIGRADIAAIEYSDDIPAQYKEKLAAMAKDADSREHCDLAEWLYENKAYDLAVIEADAALKLDVDNREAKLLKQMSERQIVWATRPEPAETTGGGGNPFATTQPAGAGVAPRTEPRKLLTADQINTMRQAELHDSDKARVRFDKNVLKRFADATPGFDAAEFGKLSDVAKALKIIKDGSADLAVDVRILDDPPVIADYRQRVQPALISGCASAACHGGAKSGTFYVQPGSADPVVYTNYYTLLRYSTTVDGTERKAIDRSNADKSLIIQFGDPRDKAEIAHPPVPGFSPLFRTAQDQRRSQITTWIGTLPSLAPAYDFGIPVHTADATTQPSGAATQPTPDAATTTPPTIPPAVPPASIPPTGQQVQPTTQPAGLPTPGKATPPPPPPPGGGDSSDPLKAARDKIKLPPIIQ